MVHLRICPHGAMEIPDASEHTGKVGCFSWQEEEPADHRLCPVHSTAMTVQILLKLDRLDLAR